MPKRNVSNPLAQARRADLWCFGKHRGARGRTTPYGTDKPPAERLEQGGVSTPARVKSPVRRTRQDSWIMVSDNEGQRILVRPMAARSLQLRHMAHSRGTSETQYHL